MMRIVPATVIASKPCLRSYAANAQAEQRETAVRPFALMGKQTPAVSRSQIAS